MNRKIISSMKLVLPVLCGAVGVFAQEQAANSLAVHASVEARAVLGLDGISKNALGSLAIENDSLIFRIKSGVIVAIPIASIQDVNLSEEDKQVGGSPVALGKAAVPFGGGRVIGMFSHKKYDFVTVSYVDSNGGLRGAIWQLNRGRTEGLAKDLASREVRVGAQETKNEAK